MKNRINPKKLLHSKWTAIQPVNKEKHFMVVEAEFDPDTKDVVLCVIEAVMTKRQQAIDWQTLKDKQLWLLGWK